jgi:dihydroorotate dehydrogenase subfamily 1
MWHARFEEPYRLGRKLISGRFVIPSGIRCTHASTIQKCFREISSLGIITTKSISHPPRKGYREPIYARYAPGCYINAVGLANPGAESFLAECEGLEVPEDKFLLVSIFGSDVETFAAAARVLRPIADGFELNMSCPHAKGYGAEIAQDTELLRRITAAVAESTGVPVFVKLSATVPDLAGTAGAAMKAGALGITMSNTIGPAMAAFGEDPILSNKFGGLSGDGIRPLGLRAVEQVRKAVGDGVPIIGMGGVASAEHVGQYALAGADFFGIGSALTGLDSDQMRDYLAGLERDVRSARTGPSSRSSCESVLGMDYFRTRVASRVDYDAELYKVTLEALPEEYRDGDLSGKFFFLWLPGGGEKPFAIFSASEKSVVVRVVGDFTRRLQSLEPGSEVLLRGPYGRPAPMFENSTLVFVGGGTGIASLLEIAQALKGGNRQIFLLGARTSAHLFDLDRFRSLGTVLTATDDGSLGVSGYVSDLIGGVLDELPATERGRLAFINCGPAPMVKRCFEVQARIVPEERIVGSIEYMTSCGVGICGKCASPSGALTCIDGPFMKAADFKPLGCRCRA